MSAKKAHFRKSRSRIVHQPFLHLRQNRKPFFNDFAKRYYALVGVERVFLPVLLPYSVPQDRHCCNAAAQFFINNILTAKLSRVLDTSFSSSLI
ncbi:TPA: hypothetical protein EYN65_21575 [Candidatus Poribacteria bacterium]|nr:hypothetical protein [Candidatus Poribacteria bacterium]